MKIALDISPLQSDHRVRGVGFYLSHLKDALKTYYPEYSYVFFTNKRSLTSQIDLVHYPYFDPFFLYLPIRKRLPTVITVHDLIPIKFSSHFPSGLRGMICWQINKQILRKADAIIVDSKSSKKDVINLVGIPERLIHVVYLAAGEEFRKLSKGRWEVQLRQKYNLPDSFALYVGDVTWNKNLPRIIQASLKANIPLVLVGKSIVQESFDKNHPWNQDLVKVKELLLRSPSVQTLGFVPDLDLVALMNLARMLVMPSLYEGFGLPVVEAMQCGTPVITSKEGSLPEVGGDAVYYVDAYHEDAIAKGMREVFNNPKLQYELSTKGLKRSKIFSWQKTAEETLKIYNQIIKSAR
ncbi:MAG: mannosyltransferase [Patescibacteria group bacterium]|nr:MAG: mannosyltransferase [Patescibacteria group bacterium]